MLRLFSKFCTAVVKPQLLQTTAEISANAQLTTQINQQLLQLEAHLQQEHVEEGQKLQKYLPSRQRKNVDELFSKLQGLDVSELEYIKFRIAQLKQQSNIN